MNSDLNLQRFVEAQSHSYDDALREIAQGRKLTHWMWYIFPQLRGLGRSSHAEYYGIAGLDEATAYLNHPVLGPRLIKICQALLQHNGLSAHAIFGSPDDLKLHSSMTLFSNVKGAPAEFRLLLQHYFDGVPDGRTLALLDANL